MLLTSLLDLSAYFDVTFSEYMVIPVSGLDGTAGYNFCASFSEEGRYELTSNHKPHRVQCSAENAWLNEGDYVSTHVKILHLKQHSVI